MHSDTQFCQLHLDTHVSKSLCTKLTRLCSKLPGSYSWILFCFVESAFFLINDYNFFYFFLIGKLL